MLCRTLDAPCIVMHYSGDGLESVHVLSVARVLLSQVAAQLNLEVCVLCSVVHSVAQAAAVMAVPMRNSSSTWALLLGKLCQALEGASPPDDELLQPDAAGTAVLGCWTCIRAAVEFASVTCGRNQ